MVLIDIKNKIQFQLKRIFNIKNDFTIKDQMRRKKYFVGNFGGELEHNCLQLQSSAANTARCYIIIKSYIITSQWTEKLKMYSTIY